MRRLSNGARQSFALEGQPKPSQAADLIHEGVLAVKFRMTIYDFIDAVHVFPTFFEAIKLAAQSFCKDVGALSCCTE